MFSQVFVYPQGEVCVQGGLHPRGISVQGEGLCPAEGVSAQGGLCPAEGLSVQGDLCLRGSLSGGSVQGGLCPGGSVREIPHMVMCGRYASYWNAFLSKLVVAK